jgi:N-acetylated-alpha-linked acidic dipeptidase
MRLWTVIAAVGLSVGAFAFSLGFAAAPQRGQGMDLHVRFDAQIHPGELRDWLKLLAAEPNHVGSPHDKANAEWILTHFKEWGWDAHIETFEVLYPTPMSETLEMTAPRHFEAMLQEPPVRDDSSATARDPALPAYVAYQGDGDVTAKLVYANYGMPDDYKQLERLGVSVKGAIVIARYGKGWRGLKPRLAQEHGAVGCIIYSDPADDGYAEDETYPAGPMRPSHGIQRGSVADMTLYPGDPLTPGVGATGDAKRLPISAAPTILKIPVLPISYADAQVFLAALGGDVAPDEWRGALPITYHVGPGPAAVHLAVKSDWSMKTIYDVIATLKGAEHPDEWVVRGNHHDGWVFGGTDPLSGQIALLAEAKALGELAKEGWRPKRTIVYGSWDAEEPMLLGSTEWVETHATELKQHAILYVNTDSNHRGIFQAGGSQDLRHFVNRIAEEIIDPETQATIGNRSRARLRVDALAPHATDDAKEDAKDAADPKKDLPIEAIGSGSDYSSFLDHLGIAALNLEFADEGDSGGVYHSRYDTFEHHSRFVDPGFVYDSLLAKTAGWLVMQAADSDAPLVQAGDFAEAMARDLADVKKLADKKRKEAREQIAMLRDRSFALAADPTKSHGDPTPLKPVPKIDFAPLERSVERLKTSARDYDGAVVARFSRLPAAKRESVRTLMDNIDQTLATDAGLPGRSWYHNIIWAPGKNTGYGVKTLPGVREGIEDERFDDAIRYVRLTADVLNAYSARLGEATRILNGR